MTRVNFYIIEATDKAKIDAFVCRLTEKICSKSRGVVMHTPDEQHTRKYDELLWSYRADSFVPHQTDHDALDDNTVLIQHDATVELPASHHGVLINLQAEVPSFFSQFERVAEIISGDEQQREQGRARYRFYRDRGYPLETHKMSL